MTPEEGLVALLLADATVSAIVGTGVYPQNIPQGKAFPAIVYRRVDREATRILGGESDLVAVTLEVDCWESTQAGCRTLADAVRSALLNVTDDLGGLTVQDIEHDLDTDVAVIDGDRRDFRVSQEFIIHYLEV